jgi:hypothetical protein
MEPQELLRCLHFWLHKFNSEILQMKEAACTHLQPSLHLAIQLGESEMKTAGSNSRPCKYASLESHVALPWLAAVRSIPLIIGGLG